MTTIETVGGLANLGGAFAVALDAGGVKFTLPTSAQRQKKAGQMTVTFSIEVQAARMRWDGTNPTAANGVLFQPGVYTMTGENLISAVVWISAVAGSLLNYQFSFGATA
jgi:hypothetical protein